MRHSLATGPPSGEPSGKPSESKQEPMKPTPSTAAPESSLLSRPSLAPPLADLPPGGIAPPLADLPPGGMAPSVHHQTTHTSDTVASAIPTRPVDAAPLSEVIPSVFQSRPFYTEGFAIADSVSESGHGQPQLRSSAPPSESPPRMDHQHPWGTQGIADSLSRQTASLAGISPCHSALGARQGAEQSPSGLWTSSHHHQRHSAQGIGRDHEGSASGSVAGGSDTESEGGSVLYTADGATSWGRPDSGNGRPAVRPPLYNTDSQHAFHFTFFSSFAYPSESPPPIMVSPRGVKRASGRRALS